MSERYLSDVIREQYVYAISTRFFAHIHGYLRHQAIVECIWHMLNWDGSPVYRRIRGDYDAVRQISLTEIEVAITTLTRSIPAATFRPSRLRSASPAASGRG